MLRIYQGEFSYFTGPNSFYPEKIIKGEPPNIRKRPNKQSAITDGTGSKEEDRRREAIMREFVLGSTEDAYDRKTSAQKQRS